jgi:hypothetical protein
MFSQCLCTVCGYYYFHMRRTGMACVNFKVHLMLYLRAVLRIRDVYPGSRIPDLGSRIQKQYQKREGKKNFVIILFSVVTNFTKLNIMLFLKC